MNKFRELVNSSTHKSRHETEDEADSEAGRQDHPKAEGIQEDSDAARETVQANQQAEAPQPNVDRTPDSRLKNLSDVILASQLDQLLSNSPKYALTRRIT